MSQHVESNADGWGDDIKLSDIDDKFVSQVCGRRLRMCGPPSGARNGAREREEKWRKPRESIVPFDLAQRSPLGGSDRCDMKPSDKPCLGKDEPSTKPSRSEEARRIIEEYAHCLREIIEKLRRRLH